MKAKYSIIDSILRKGLKVVHIIINVEKPQQK